jgi:hypothetical protein
VFANRYCRGLQVLRMTYLSYLPIGTYIGMYHLVVETSSIDLVLIGSDLGNVPYARAGARLKKPLLRSPYGVPRYIVGQSDLRSFALPSGRQYFAPNHIGLTLDRSFIGLFSTRFYSWHTPYPYSVHLPE